MAAIAATAQPLATRRIVQVWGPLAASWLLMTIEIPGLSAIVARTEDPKVHLAAWGLAFSIALIIASPVIMMLAASTALSKDSQSYTLLRRYMWVLSAGLTAAHAVLVFTPLYYVVIEGFIAAPPEIVEPVRLGLTIMLPYSVSLAYRRFNYGVLIRFGHSRAITAGTFARLVIDGFVLLLLYWIGGFSGIAIATITITAGVAFEAVYSGLRVQPVLRRQLRVATAATTPLSLNAFVTFYMPLVLTSILQIVVQPMSTAALSRMADPLQSLAVWPVVYGLVMLWSSAGIAYTEAVVVLIEEPHAVHTLHRFTVRAAALAVGLLFLMNVTGLADFWFRSVAGLPFDLVPNAGIALWFTLLLPGLSFLQSWYTGTLMFGRRTRAITESVVISILVNGAFLLAGAAQGLLPGLYVGIIALVIGQLTRTAWLWMRARPTLRTLRAQETPMVPQAVGA